MTLQLAHVIDTDNLKAAWKELRGNFRQDEIKDPILHLDFETDLERQLSRIQRDISEHRYRVSAFWNLKCGKGKGLFRLHTFLDARDLLILHGIVRKLERDLLRAAPTRSTYYSRSTRRAPSPDEAMPPGYPWFLWWRAFQRKILRFSTAFDFLVTTDIAGYYDHIQHRFLRDCIQAAAKCDRRVSDLLFFILESLTHRPEYIPNVLSGLPVLNYDAPRLLAHVFLYDVDRALAGTPSIEFTRWMDDINVGVRSEAKGRRVVQVICERLRKYYLMPNSSKTRIIPSTELDSEFHFTENTWLSRREANTKVAGRTGRHLARRREQLRQRFDQFLAVGPKGNWDKVLKRYYTFFGYLQDPYLIGRASSDLVQMPGLAPSIARYFLVLGFAQRVLDAVENYLRSRDNIYEDVEVRLLDFLLDWRVPNSAEAKQRIGGIAREIFGAPARHSASARAVAVALRAKYGRVSEMNEVIEWYFGAQEEDPLVREYALAFSPLAGPRSPRYRKLVEFASGEPGETVHRLGSFYRDLLTARSVPSPVRRSMTCSQTSVPAFSVFPIRRLAVLYALAANPRFRRDVRSLVRKLRNKNEDKLIDAHLARLQKLR